MLKRLFNDENGQGMTEYILIVILVAVAAISVIKIFGSQIQAMFGGAANKMQTETEPMGIYEE